MSKDDGTEMHPWYGPHDGFAFGGNCSVCANLSDPEKRAEHWEWYARTLQDDLRRMAASRDELRRRLTELKATL